MSGWARPPRAGWRGPGAARRPGRGRGAAVPPGGRQAAGGRGRGARPSSPGPSSQLADLKLGKRPEEIARIEANLAEAKAALTYAEQDLDRQASWSARDFAAEARLRSGALGADEAQARVSAMEADLATARLPARDDQIVAAEAEVAMREANLAQARWELGQRTVTPPWPPGRGPNPRHRRVGQCRRHRGQLLPAGKVKVRFFVPEPELGRIHVGQRVASALRRLPCGHDRHDPLHRPRGRVHAAGDLQHRQPRQAGVHGRGLADAGRRPS